MCKTLRQFCIDSIKNHFTPLDLTPLGRSKGCYVLVCYSRHPKTLNVGRLGIITLDTGYYYYVGSAFGSGGLQSRLKRHLSPANRLHWHFDYVKSHLIIISIWWTNDQKKVEHQWAEILAKLESTKIPLFRFGASDCQCSSHFFYSANLLKLKDLSQSTPVHCDVIHRQ